MPARGRHRVKHLSHGELATEMELQCGSLAERARVLLNEKYNLVKE